MYIYTYIYTCLQLVEFRNMATFCKKQVCYPLEKDREASSGPQLRLDSDSCSSSGTGTVHLISSYPTSRGMLHDRGVNANQQHYRNCWEVIWNNGGLAQATGSLGSLFLQASH